MDLKNISLFKQLDQKMTWLNQRQKVLAQNIANANTPGYVSQDLKKVSFQSHLNNSSTADSDLSGTVMKVNQPGHMRGSRGIAASFEIRQENSEFWNQNQTVTRLISNASFPSWLKFRWNIRWLPIFIKNILVCLKSQ